MNRPPGRMDTSEIFWLSTAEYKKAFTYGPVSAPARPRPGIAGNGVERTLWREAERERKYRQGISGFLYSFSSFFAVGGTARRGAAERRSGARRGVYVRRAGAPHPQPPPPPQLRSPPAIYFFFVSRLSF